MDLRPFRLGLQLPEVEYVASWHEHVAMARIAEEIGLDSLWLGDHLLYRDATGRARGPWECLTMLSALAGVTSRITLGPLVLATAFRNPALTAKVAATIDEISGGRFILGLGAGWNRTEFKAFGYPFDRRVDRFAEAFEIIRRLLREGDVTFSGEFHQVDACVILPGGPRAGSLPLMIGSIGERVLRITLPHADAWNIWYADFGNSVDGVRAHVARVEALAREAGRAPGAVEKTAAVLVTAPDGTGRHAGGESGPSLLPIAGSPDAIAETLLAFRDAGLDHLQIVLDPITPASIAWLEPVVAAVRRHAQH